MVQFHYIALNIKKYWEDIVKWKKDNEVPMEVINT